MRFVKMALFLLLLPACVMAQGGDEILARIGNTTITKREFIERYEFSLQEGREQKGINENLKEEILYSMIAEKLWAAEAEKNKMDTISIVANSINEYEKIFVRDELFNREIKNKAKGDADKYLAELLNTPSSMKIWYISSTSEKRIRDSYKLLKAGYPFDSLASDVNTNENKKQTAVFEIGQVPEPAGSEMFGLKKGETGSPFLLDSIWIVYKVEEVGPLCGKIYTSTDKEFVKLKKAATDRAVQEYYAEYMKKFFKGKKIDVNKHIFSSLVQNLYEILKERKNVDDSSGKAITLTYEEINRLKSRYTNDTLKMVYVKFSENPTTLEGFLRYIFLENFTTKYRDLQSVKKALSLKNKEYIERELLTRQGYKEGLQKSGEVQYELGVWKNYALSQVYQTAFNDSSKVTEEQMRDFYQKKYVNKPDVTEVNLEEVLNDTLSVVQEIYEKVKAGESLKLLAAQHTKREWLKERGGESGLVDAVMFGETGKIASGLKIGELYGPAKTDEGYTLFKVIDKKTVSLADIRKYEDIKDDLKKELGFTKLRNSMINTTAKLATANGLKIDEKLLKSTEVSNMNVLVYRYMGFGGRMPAVPMVYPFTEWVEQWKKMSKQSL